MFHYWLKSLRRSLKWKLISISVIILVFTVTTIGFLSYSQTSSSVRSDIDHLSVQVLKQANMNLDRYYTEYEMNFLMLGNSLEVREWLHLSTAPVSSELIRYYDRIKENYLNRLFLQYPEVLSVTIYKPGGAEHHFVNTYALPLSYSIKDEPYFAPTGNYEKVRFLTGISGQYLDANNRKLEIPVLTLFKQFYDGYLKMDISLQTSQRVMDQIQIIDSGSAIVMDQEGTIIHHSSPEMVMGQMDERIIGTVKDKQEGSVYDRERKVLIIFQTIGITGWKIIAILPYGELAKSIAYTRNTTIAIVIGALLISAVLTYFAATSITRRISALRKIMKRMQMRHDYSIRADDSGTDEVADLSKSFNSLLDNLEQSIHDHAETRVLQHRAVISALQSQINSHFLYNSLETINSMAVIVKQTQIGHVAVSLSNMLRYTSDYKQYQVKLSEEMGHVRNYLNIMKARFKDEITYEAHIPSELSEVLCTKALLQPLVENSIKHSREATGEPVHICITGELLETKRLLLTVWDNGPGFAVETLVRLRMEQEDQETRPYTFTQVGLSNLIYRLYMFYQTEAEIQFYNDPDSGGAVVEVILPVRYMPEQTEAEEDDAQ